MQAFEYARPKSTQEAVKLLSGAEGEALPLAGGTDLISLMKDGVATPKRLVSLQHVTELKGITFHRESGLRLGAGVTLEELMENAEVRAALPRFGSGGGGSQQPASPQHGNRGRRPCQRPRCWYYRAGFGLLAVYKGKPLVPDGDNRYHAILGNSGPAYFVSPSSLAPILIALDAKVKLHGPQGARELSVQDFFVTPKSENETRTRAASGRNRDGDPWCRIRATSKWRSTKCAQKEALDWPLAAAAVVLKLDGGNVQSARVVLGHVAPVPWPSPEAEEALKGKSVDEDTAWEAGKAALSKATPLSKNAYKVQLARVAVKRAILRAAKGEA